jgi:hypothetical protein
MVSSAGVVSKTLVAKIPGFAITISSTEINAGVVSEQVTVR